MSDAVLTAIIAATATLCATFMQLRAALAREADARSRGQPVSRRRSRLPMILVAIMLVASAVGGFALSQWLGTPQQSAQADVLREMTAQVRKLDEAVAALAASRATTPGPTVDSALPVAVELAQTNPQPPSGLAPSQPTSDAPPPAEVADRVEAQPLAVVGVASSDIEAAAR